MRIIPAIDLIGGKCVRLEQGDYQKQTTYHADPLEVAKSFEGHGLRYLHLVDLDGAKAGQVINWRVLERIASQTSLQVDFGGGIKTEADLRVAFDSGARQINVGSLAVKDRAQMLAWIEERGGDKIILSADVRQGKVAVSGWQEQTELWVVDFVRSYLEAGLQIAVVTDIAKDGMLAGPSADLYAELLDELPTLKLVASGGISSIDDLYRLQEGGLEGAIIGKAIYEGRISLKELEAFPK
jgi:phosphoribosylformimino-5-aminoimidazole carboxamide ribotide isomerase